MRASTSCWGIMDESDASACRLPLPPSENTLLLSRQTKKSPDLLARDAAASMSGLGISPRNGVLQEVSA